MDLDNFPTNETAIRMLESVSNGFYDNSYVGKWLFQVMGIEMETVRQMYAELPYQCYVETATWGLRYHEEKCRLEVREDLSYEERRRRIYQKRKSTGSITPYRMEQIIKAMSGFEVAVIENDTIPNVFSIHLYNTENPKKNEIIQEIVKKINSIKQSHVAYDVTIFKEQDITWYVGSAAVSIAHRHALNHRQSNVGIDSRNYAAAGLRFYPKIIIDNNKTLEPVSTPGKIYAASGYRTMRKTMIDNRTIGTASGTGSVLIPDAWDAPIQDMTVLGRSTQATTKGAQLFDVSAYTARTLNVATLAVVDDTITIASATSTNVDIYVGAVTLYSAEDRQYDVQPNTTYYLSNSSVTFSNIANMANCQFYVGFFNNATHLSYINGGGNSRFGFSFTTPENCNKIVIRFGWRQTVAALGESMTVTKVMLNKGATALAWEPYTGGIPSPNPNYPQPITSVENPVIVSTDGDGLISTVDLTGYTLRGIDNVRDRIERRDGVWGIERYCGMVTAESDNFQRTDTAVAGKYRWVIIANNAMRSNSYSLLGGYCNYLGEIERGETWYAIRDGWAYSSTENNRLYLYSGNWSTTTREELLFELQDASLTILYRLASPVWEPFSDNIQQQFNNLRTYRGDNSAVYIVSEIAPDLSVTYIQDSNKVVQQLKLDMAEQEIDVLAAIDQLKIDTI